MRQAIPIRGQLHGEHLINVLNKLFEDVQGHRKGRQVRFRIAYVTYEEVLVDEDETGTAA